MKDWIDWGNMLRNTTIGGVLALVSMTGAWGADITVNSNSDDGPTCGVPGTKCLREAIADAAASPDSDKVVVPAGTYLLSRGVLSVPGGGDLVIEGAGANQTTISAAGANPGHRVFQVEFGGTVIFRGLTVTGGNTPGSGGGIATLNLFLTGTVVVDRCVIMGNTAGGSGGGISMDLGTELRVENSTISGNKAVDYGGGIWEGNIGQSAKITQSTISGNSAGSAGGGVWAKALTIEASTITANENGGIVAQAASSIKNSVIAKQVSGSDCGGAAAYASNAYNIFSGGCGAGATDSTADPMLVPLSNNGGPTPTHGLLIGSPAIDNIALGCVQTEDQRGVFRPQGAACDTGAFEYLQDAVGTIQILLAWFDSQVTSGALVGAGAGKSAEGRLNALRNMLLAADNKLGNGNQEAACGELKEVLRRTDGQPKPDDFVMDGNVVGTVATLAGKISELMTAQGCTL